MMLTQGSKVDAQGCERLSCLADGALDQDGVERACSDWRDDAQLRVTWHAYHLIGDVLRSDELAQAPLRDEAFLSRIRERLASEPIILAPAATYEAGHRDSRGRAYRRWMVPVAVAAGVATVAGVLVVTRLSGSGVESTAVPQIASRDVQGPTRPVLLSGPAVAAPVAPSATEVAQEGTLIRSEDLDRYLDAHRQYGNGAAFVPGTVRSVSNASAGR